MRQRRDVPLSAAAGSHAAQRRAYSQIAAPLPFVWFVWFVVTFCCGCTRHAVPRLQEDRRASASICGERGQPLMSRRCWRRNSVGLTLNTRLNTVLK